MALTKFNYNSFDVTPVASTTMAFNSGANGLTTMADGDMVLIKTLTASSSATLSFLNGSDDVVFDATYPIYKFVFTNIHPATDSVEFSFQVDTGTNTSYNQQITSTVFRAFHDEADTGTGLAYYDQDQANGTSFQDISDDVGNGNDESVSGELWLFNPSSATFVKHFMATTQDYNANDHSLNWYTAGYVNTATALTRVQFKFESGNMDSGTIKLYGIKDS